MRDSKGNRVRDSKGNRVRDSKGNRLLSAPERRVGRVRNICSCALGGVGIPQVLIRYIPKISIIMLI